MHGTAAVSLTDDERAAWPEVCGLQHTRLPQAALPSDTSSRWEAVVPEGPDSCVPDMPVRNQLHVAFPLSSACACPARSGAETHHAVDGWALLTSPASQCCLLQTECHGFSLLTEIAHRDTLVSSCNWVRVDLTVARVAEVCTVYATVHGGGLATQHAVEHHRAHSRVTWSGLNDFVQVPLREVAC